MSERLQSLSGLDASFLYLEAAGTPMHVGSLMLLDLPKRRGYDFYRSVCALVESRLPQIQALRRVLKAAPLGLGHPLWMEVPTVKLRQHIVERRLRAPGSDAQLHALVARLQATALPRDRPLWQFVVIHGHHSGALAFYTRIHHALLDGQGGVALAKLLLDAEPVFPNLRSTSPKQRVAVLPEPSGVVALAQTAARASFSQIVHLLRGLPPALRLARASVASSTGLIGELRRNLLFAPKSAFNRHIDDSRSFATLSLPLAEIKRLSSGFGVSLNDLVMALCAHALRAWLKSQKALPSKPLIAAMPISLRARGETEASNQVSMVQCSLATQISDDLARLRAIQASTAQIKDRVRAFGNLIPTDFPGLAAPLWATGLSRWWGAGGNSERLPILANLVISNVPGPPLPLYLAGARVRHNYPVSIVTHGLGLNITLQSYAGQLEFGILSCQQALADADDLSELIERAARAYSELLPDVTTS